MNRFDKLRCRRAAFVDELKYFGHLRFGIEFDDATKLENVFDGDTE